MKNRTYVVKEAQEQSTIGLDKFNFLAPDFLGMQFYFPARYCTDNGCSNSKSAPNQEMTENITI